MTFNVLFLLLVSLVLHRETYRGLPVFLWWNGLPDKLSEFRCAHRCVCVCVCDKGPDAMFLPLSLSLLPLDRFYRLFWCNLVGVLQLFSVYSNSNKHILQQQGHKGSTAYRVQRSYGCG